LTEERSGGFLPPEPAGPEPELGGRPAGPPPAGAGVPPPSAPGAAPQAPPPAYGQGNPPAYGQGNPPAYGQGNPPAYGQGNPPAYGQGNPFPPAGSQGQPAQWGAQTWGYQQPVPDNNPAIAGFVLSLVAAGLLLITGGLSSILSVGCAIAGIVYSRKGRKRVDSGETPKHRGLAQAGFIIGIVTLVLAALATAFWTLILVLALTDDEFQNDLEREFDQSDSIRAAVRFALAAGRLGLHLVA
jgi:hypothetical protein